MNELIAAALITWTIEHLGDQAAADLADYLLAVLA